MYWVLNIWCCFSISKICRGIGRLTWGLKLVYGHLPDPSLHVVDLDSYVELASYSMRQRRSIYFSRSFLSRNNTYLYLSLIHNNLSLVKAMRTLFYCRFSDTEDDGGGLKWDFISRCWIIYTMSVELLEVQPYCVCIRTVGGVNAS